MPIIDKFKDMGTVVMGKVESGTIHEGDSLLVIPNKVQVKVIAVYIDENKVKVAGPGDNLRVRLAGIEEEDILSGFVLSSIYTNVMSTDPSHELFLHSSDHPNCSLSSEPLEGSNYGQWKRSCEVSLLSENKLGFVTGSCIKPATGPLLSQWERCNAMVISWLLHSIKKDIATSVLFCSTAKQIWEELKLRYGQSQGTKIFQIQREINNLSQAKPIAAVNEFVAQLQILELLENAIFTAGYKAVLHLHSVVEECEIVELLQQIDPKTKKPMKKKVLFVKNGAVVLCRIQLNNLIYIEKFSDFPQLGRFTLRTEGKTIAVGKVTGLPSVAGNV